MRALPPCNRRHSGIVSEYPLVQTITDHVDQPHEMRSEKETSPTPDGIEDVSWLTRGHRRQAGGRAPQTSSRPLVRSRHPPAGVRPASPAATGAAPHTGPFCHMRSTCVTGSRMWSTCGTRTGASGPLAGGGVGADDALALLLLAAP